MVRSQEQEVIIGQHALEVGALLVLEHEALRVAGRGAEGGKTHKASMVAQGREGGREGGRRGLVVQTSLVHTDVAARVFSVSVVCVRRACVCIKLAGVRLGDVHGLDVQCAVCACVCVCDTGRRAM